VHPSGNLVAGIHVTRIDGGPEPINMLTFGAGCCCCWWPVCRLEKFRISGGWMTLDLQGTGVIVKDYGIVIINHILP